MENTPTQTPQFNFVQLLGLLCFIPIIDSIPKTFNTDLGWIITTITGVSTFIGVCFFFKKNWIRYVLSFIIILLFIAALYLIIDYIPNLGIGFLFTILGYSCLGLGIFLMILNIGILVEFNRPKGQPINYQVALQEAHANQHYFFKNSLDLTSIIGLILVVPFILNIPAIYYEINDGIFNFYTELYNRFFALSSLICGIGCFFKIKSIRYISIFFVVILFFLNILEFNSTERIRDVLLLGSLFLAMFFHPIVAHSFENTIESIKDYEDILDTDI